MPSGPTWSTGSSASDRTPSDVEPEGIASLVSARAAGGLLAVAGSRCLAHMITGRDASAMSVGSPMMDTDVVFVHAFNDAITARDLARLEALMHPEHRFVDTAGTTVSGRAECLAAWAAFFTSFHDYRNVFELIEVEVPGRVTATGDSRCTVEPLDGPAIWQVVVVDGSILDRRVDDPATPQEAAPERPARSGRGGRLNQYDGRR